MAAEHCGMSGAPYISVVAPKHSLPQQLVAAIVQVESGGDRFALRCEPAYGYLWNVDANRPYTVRAWISSARRAPSDFPTPRGISRDTEWIGQQSSWGLMQVMGAVAREQGHTGHFPALCDPLEGLNAGCRHLARLRDRYLSAHGWRGVAAAYNAGSPRLADGGGFENQAYVDKIAAARGFEGLE